MKKKILLAGLLCLIFFILSNIAHASYSSFAGLVTDLIASISSISSKNFGGTITIIEEAKEVKDIKEWKDQGYTCTPDGEYITVKSKIGTSGYFISSSVKNAKRGGTISENKQILGRYSGTKKIECTNGDDTQSVNLKKITYFGT